MKWIFDLEFQHVLVAAETAATTQIGEMSV